MTFRNPSRWRAVVLPLVLALSMAACGGDGEAGDGETATGDAATDGAAAPGDGPTITVGSFNFGESVTIAYIYGLAMADAGYDVDYELNLATRELLYEDLKSGAIGFLPEYVGSALSVGFQGEATADVDATTDALRDEMAAIGFTVLEPSPAQDQNAYVVTKAFADEHGLTTISDLGKLDSFSLAGAPECEGRSTCLDGLRDVYGLDNLEFVSIQETPIRVSSLRNGDVDVAALFSTDPPLKDGDLVVLEDDQGITPAENVVPVVADDILDAYGQDLIDLIDAISAALTTEDLIALNTEVYVNGADSEEQARLWLESNGFLTAA